MNDKNTTVNVTRDDRSQWPSESEHGQQTQVSSLVSIQIVEFADHDVQVPYNWRLLKKLLVYFTVCILAINSTVSSAITSNVVDQIMQEFGIHDDIQAYLPSTMYLIGYTFGPLVFSPLSETYGRKVVIFWTFNAFILFTLGSALSRNWPSLLVFRLLCGTFASVPLTLNGGIFGDLFLSAQARGRAMTLFMSCTTFSPMCGPIISGFIGPLGWRWALWIALIMAGCTWIPVVLMPETYLPELLRRKAHRLRKTTGNPNIMSPIELEASRSGSSRSFVVVSLARPLRMLVFEPLVYLNCMYIAFLYSFFYMFFEAYPIIFTSVYNFTKGQASLALLPIGLGACLTAPVLISYDTIFERARKRGAAWAQREELHRLPVACLGGPFCVVSFFWLAWTAREGYPWITPCMSGLFFGFAYLLIFTALINYQVDAYEIYAASAMAASCFSRSIIGAVLPLAVGPLYARLGVGWATSTLGFLSLLLVAIPFSFIYYGPEIRRRSKMCQELTLLAEERREKLQNDNTA